MTTGSPLALWLGVAALLGAATVAAVSASMLPLLASTLTRTAHCTRHADEHLHLCLVHPPAAVLGLKALVVGVAGLVLVLVRAVPALVLLAPALHHATETVLSLLAHS